jgi:hypothetical protein
LNDVYIDKLTAKHYHLSMDKRKRPRDLNQRAASTVAIATGQMTEPEIIPEPTPEERHNAAVTLGRKGGQSRAKNLTPEQRSEIAKKAAKARWAK